MKKFVIMVISVFLILLIGVTYVYQAIKSESNTAMLVKTSISLGDTLIKFKRGLDNRENFYSEHENFIGENIKVKIDSYLADLKASGVGDFNITEYYNTHFGNMSEYTEYIGSGASDDSWLEDEEDQFIEVEEFELDSRLVLKDGEYYIPTSSLDFGHNGYDIVGYEGIYMKVFEELVPETYEKSINNPENFYTYMSHKLVEEAGVIYNDILFHSPYTGKKVKVRVEIEDKKIKDFKVVE